MVKHVILDTDIGGDPDDLICLLLGINSPEIKIDLVVTCDKHKGHRAVFAEKVLNKLNRKIPVARGMDIGHDKYCLVCSEEERPMEYLKAVEEVIKKNDKTYYVCIGPESNLASLLDYLPKRMHDRIEVVIMGGAINYRHPGMAEHNVRSDVEAAKKVFSSGLKKRYVISDVTFNEKLAVDKNHNIYNNIKKSPAGDLIIPSIDKFLENHFPATLMHDPLTLSYLLNTSFLEFEEKKIVMDEKGIMGLGDAGKPTIISSDADYEGFMKFLESRVVF